MRRVNGAEILLFARLLYLVPAARQRVFAIDLLDEVEAAASHLRHFGRCHPRFGDGSLMARCLSLSPPPEPIATDPAFLTALVSGCQALLDHYKA
ncbi:hypothetical protein MCELHM10_01472 [Paracoccaceae bacterium]|jgi:hypothetical protein